MLSHNFDLLHAFTLKVASRCNLDCSYCYVYNKADSSWKNRTPLMSNEVYSAAIRQIREFCLQTGQSMISLTFHGGEPCLVGSSRVDDWCAEARAALNGIARIRFAIQTNATLLDVRWAEVLRKHSIDVGISLDGPKEINDVFRIDQRGLGSYDAVERGIRTLREADIGFAILSVINPEADPLWVHRHFVGLGATGISYLMPDFTHDSIDEFRARFGPTPCADFLVQVFDEWWFHNTMNVSVQPFRGIAEIILGGASRSDNYGTQPLGFLFIETDGTVEGLDVLKICENGLTRTPINVLRNSFEDLARIDDLNRQFIFEERPTPSECTGCPEKTTCAGGYLPHRYSRALRFANRSVWCADILKVFRHIRDRLDVAADETRLRRQVLAEMMAEYTMAE